MREYIVTCKSYEDLEELYNDMETPGGSLYIPDRAVELVHRRTISRNTHYMLTEEEAEQIGNDPRVIACELTMKDLPIEVDFAWTQTADFNKTDSSFDGGDDKNWGLYRILQGQSASLPDPQTFNITVTTPGFAYTLSGTDRSGSVSGDNATVTLTVGDTINFNLSSVSVSHPFFIRDSNGGANVSNPAATNQGSTGTATVSWTPNTAGSYVYQCGNHPGMIGTITVNATSGSNNWGSDAVAELTNSTIVCPGSGKNVDVVIVDSHINPDHPEFAVNPDGTGGSRVNQFNWFQYSTALGETTPATYTYSTSGASPNSNHGTHVAATACGNTQGWARDANIYNMAFTDALASTNVGNDNVSNWSQKLWDYLRHFHKNKAINPETGRRNPTITNHSWGSQWGTFLATSITSTTYRGTTQTSIGLASLEANGIPCPAHPSIRAMPARNTATEADIQDAIDDGVIIISAAGNSYWNCDISTGVDYNNTITSTSLASTEFHSRGSTPSAADNVICVGNIGSLSQEYKRSSSNWGARIDIWAPGTDIISAVYDSASATTENSGSYTPIIADSRDNSFHLASISGTSMASPQVAGVIACLAEQEPYLTQAEALQYLKEHAVAEVGTTGTENTSPYRTLGANSNNRYMTLPKKRPLSGTLSPALLHKNRNPDNPGVKFPRIRSNRVFA